MSRSFTSIFAHISPNIQARHERQTCFLFSACSSQKEIHFWYADESPGILVKRIMSHGIGENMPIGFVPSPSSSMA